VMRLFVGESRSIVEPFCPWGLWVAGLKTWWILMVLKVCNCVREIEILSVEMILKREKIRLEKSK